MDNNIQFISNYGFGGNRVRQNIAGQYIAVYNFPHFVILVDLLLHFVGRVNER